MESVSLSFSFPNDAVDDARSYALELRGYLLNRRIVPGAEVVKDRDDTADLGSVIEVVLATPLMGSIATELSKAIADWWRSRQRGDEEQQRSDLTVLVRRKAGDVEEVVEASGNPDDVRDALREFLAASPPEVG